MKKIFLFFISLLAWFSAHSQAGSLDPSFAGKGWTTTNFSTGNVLDEEGSQVLLLNNGTYLVLFETRNYAMLARYLSKNNALDKSFGTGGYSAPIKLQRPKAALQSDGKIVISGGVYNPAANNDDFGLARFNPNGSLDVSFGTNGLQTTDFGSYEYAGAVAIQSDGKIVVAGGVYDPATGSDDFGLARYNPNGSLDVSFGTNGLQTTDFGFYEYARGLAIQSDGKIVVAGGIYDPAASNEDFGLARYNTDGLLDNTFSEDGKQTTDFGDSYDNANAIAIQSDGKIVVAGGVSNPAPGNRDFGLARYNTDGLLDNTFSEDGKQTTDFGSYDNANGVAIQSDGKIVVVGEIESATTENEDIGLARYNTNGVLDKNFDRDGKLTRYFPASDGTFYAIAVQSDGKVVVAGRAKNLSDNYDFALARYNADGSLDRNFNRSGKQTTDFFGGSDYVHGVAIQSDGKIVVAGRVFNPTTDNNDFGLARYNTNGSLDKTFSGDGKQTTDFGSYEDARGLAIQSDGKIVVVGEFYNPESGSGDFGLARYNMNGVLDNTFGTNGKQTTDFGGSDEYARGLAIQSDGKIVVAGGIYNYASGSDDFGLARYTTDGLLDNDFDGDGLQITDFGSSEYANAIAIQSDGKIVVGGGIYDPTSNNEDFALVRYTTDGLLDNTFSEDGLQTTDFGTYDFARAVAIQSDGKIVLGGQVQAPASGSDDIGLARYNTDGSLDNTFDGDGKQITDFGGDDNYAHALAIRNNRLYVGGRSNGLMRSGAVAVYSLGTISSASSTNIVTSAKVNPIAQEQILAQKLTVKVLSNPSASYFTLLPQSVSNSTLSISISDASGRLIETKANVAVNSTLQLGNNYNPGIYYVVILLGREKAVVKLLKQ
jgi:uncharacterized delta-60 repeat protein